MKVDPKPDPFAGWGFSGLRVCGFWRSLDISEDSLDSTSKIYIALLHIIIYVLYILLLCQQRLINLKDIRLISLTGIGVLLSVEDIRPR